MRLCLLLGAAAVLAASAVYAVSQPERAVTTRSEEAYQCYLKGMEAMKRHFLPEARREWTRAVELDSTFAMAWVRLARLAHSYGELEEAQKSYLKAQARINRVREKERLHIRLLAADLTRAETERQALLAELMRKFPQDDEILMMTGNRAFRRGDHQAALAAFQKLSVVSPDFGQAYNMMGYTLSELGRWEEATEAFQKYTFLNPDQPNPHDSLGELYLRTGRYENALAEFRKALELKPDFCWALYHQAMVQEALGRFDDGLSCIRQGRTISPDEPDAKYWDRFEIILETLAGREERALSLALPYEKEHPDDFMAPFFPGFVQSRLGNVAEARRWQARLEEKLELAARSDVKPGSEEMPGLLRNELAGHIEMAEGRWIEAADHFAAALKESDSWWMCRVLTIAQMEALVAAGRPHEALDAGSKVLSVNPHDPGVNFWCARSLDAMGRSGEAMAHYREVIRVAGKLENGRPDFVKTAMERVGSS